MLDQLAEEITAGGGSAVAIVCDVADRADVARAVADSEKKLGGPFDLAIANAGVSIPGHASKFNLDDAERVIKVTIDQAFPNCSRYIPRMAPIGPPPKDWPTP